MTTEKNRARLRNPIAVSFLRASGTKKRVVVKIGRPRPWRGDWRCPYEISGLKGQNGVRYARGIDSMRALQSTFWLIRHYLDASGRTLTRNGGEPGDEGFPLSSGDYCGPLQGRRRIERFINAENARHERKWARLRARHRARVAARRKMPGSLKIGESVVFISLPAWVDELPEASRKVFKFCLGKTLRIAEIDAYGNPVLDVSSIAGSRFGGFMNDMRVEPQYVRRASTSAARPLKKRKDL